MALRVLEGMGWGSYFTYVGQGRIIGWDDNGAETERRLEKILSMGRGSKSWKWQHPLASAHGWHQNRHHFTEGMETRDPATQAKLKGNSHLWFNKTIKNRQGLRIQISSNLQMWSDFKAAIFDLWLLFSFFSLLYFPFPFHSHFKFFNSNHH